MHASKGTKYERLRNRQAATRLQKEADELAAMRRVMERAGVATTPKSLQAGKPA